MAANPEISGSARKLSVPRARKRIGFTRRAAGLLVVLLILGISYGNSIRIFLVQQRDLADTRQRIAVSQEKVSRYTEELRRWDDPAYVKVQARNRLGWVMPGEVGYYVIGADGKVMSGSVEDEEITIGRLNSENTAWWGHLWGTVEVADNSVPPSGP